MRAARLPGYLRIHMRRDPWSHQMIHLAGDNYVRLRAAELRVGDLDLIGLGGHRKFNVDIQRRIAAHLDVQWTNIDFSRV